MKTRHLAAAGLALAVGAAANAAMIVNSVTDGAGTRFDTAEMVNGECTQLVQRVSINGTYNLDNIQINANGEGFNLHLARAIGESASDASDIVWSANNIATSDNTFDWMSFDAEGVTVGPGEYYLVMTSTTEDGGRWRQVLRTAEGTEGIGNSGEFSFLKSGEESVVSHNYSDSSSRWVYGARLTGELVPAPGAAALFGLGGLAAARRRR